MDKIIRAFRLKCYGAIDLIIKTEKLADSFLFNNVIHLLVEYIIRDKIDNYTFVKVVKILISNGMKFDKLTNVRDLIDILKEHKKDIPYGILLMGTTYDKHLSDIDAFANAIKKSNLIGCSTVNRANVHTYIGTVLKGITNSFNTNMFIDAIKVKKGVEVDERENMGSIKSITIEFFPGLSSTVSRTSFVANIENQNIVDNLIAVNTREIQNRLERMVYLFGTDLLRICGIKIITLAEFQMMDYNDLVSYYIGASRNLEQHITSVFRKSNALNETIIGLQKLFLSGEQTACNIYASHNNIILNELTKKYSRIRQQKSQKN